MRIVVDSNRVIAALIKESTTRETIFQKEFEFIAPDFIESEIDSHKNHIVESAGITDEGFEILLSLILENITLIPQTDYIGFFNELKKEIKDEKDIPYLAVCLAKGAKGVWTHDPHFLEQKRIKIFTNKDMLEFIVGQSE